MSPPQKARHSIPQLRFQLYRISSSSRARNNLRFNKMATTSVSGARSRARHIHDELRRRRRRIRPPVVHFQHVRRGLPWFVVAFLRIYSRGDQIRTWTSHRQRQVRGVGAVLLHSRPGEGAAGKEMSGASDQYGHREVFDEIVGGEGIMDVDYLAVVERRRDRAATDFCIIYLLLLYCNKS